ncbi:hypothetical protein FNV43_RR01989 [Rhamnella rubrinervis]|uniref:Uncharacterized protein n=1 Tax=Rhamnella rubrinervis TaxID=2594499 RepID=A0A8K0HQU9_9ROSA|nr:hypothetical protein FNV43_RR01989 [Rhamnella rubrinervis]
MKAEDIYGKASTTQQTQCFQYVKVGTDRRAGLNRFLASWKSADYPRIGNYTVRIDPAGSPQLILYEGQVPWFRHWSKSCDINMDIVVLLVFDPNNTTEFECTCFPGFEPKSRSEWNFRDGTHGCAR